MLSTHLEHDDLKYRKLTDVPTSLLEKYRELEEERSAVAVLDMLPAWNKVEIDVLRFVFDLLRVSCLGHTPEVFEA